MARNSDTENAVTGKPVETSNAEGSTTDTIESAADSSASEIPNAPDASDEAKAKDESPEKSGKKTGKVRNVAMAGKSVYAVTGKPVEFDADGLAQPDSDDLAQLLKVPGYEEV